VVERFRPEVKTQNLRMAVVDASDRATVWDGMSRVSIFSRHDRPRGAPVNFPKIQEIRADWDALLNFAVAAIEQKRPLKAKRKQGPILSSFRAESFFESVAM
jgi:hypothetical protein